MAKASEHLRTGYRELFQKASRAKDDLADPTKEGLITYLQNCNDLFVQVEKPREQAQDSLCFVLGTERGAEQAKKLAAGGLNRTCTDFIRRLKVHYSSGFDTQEDAALNPSAFSFDAMARARDSWLVQQFKTAPGLYCMLGPLEAKPKERKKAVRQVRKVVGTETRPEELQGDVGDNNKQETDRNLQEMWDALHALPSGSAPILETFMNPASFSQSVENLFTLSCAVALGKVRLSDSEAGLVVHVVNPEDKKAATASGSDSTAGRLQFIEDYSMADWEDWRTYVRAQDCIMRPRNDDEELAAVVAEAAERAQQQRRKGKAAAAPAPAGEQGRRGARRPAVVQDEEEEEEEEEDEEDEEEEEVRRPPPRKASKRHKH